MSPTAVRQSLPCPGCGMTRLAVATAQGRVGTAVRADVAGVLIIGVVAVLALTHLTVVIRHKRSPPSWMRHVALLIAIVALLPHVKTSEKG